MNASPLSLSVLLMLASFGATEAATTPSEDVTLVRTDMDSPAAIVPVPDFETPQMPEAEKPLPFLRAA